MADPISFPEMNRVLVGPEGSDTLPLPCFADGEQVISAWRLSPEELAAIAETGIIWCHVLGETTMPIYLNGKYPFVVQKN